MQMITPAIVEVKPTSEVFFLGFPTELDLIERDARDAFDALDDISDAEWDRMADAALERDRAEAGCWM